MPPFFILARWKKVLVPSKPLDYIYSSWYNAERAYCMTNN